MLLVGAVILALYFAREILIPLALALTLNFLLTPAVSFLQKLHLGRIAAVLLVVLISIIGVAGVGWVVTTQLLDVANELPKYRVNIHNKIAAIHSPSSGILGRATASVKDISNELLASPVVVPSQASRRHGALPNSQPNATTRVEIVENPPNGFQYLHDLVMPVLKPLGMTGIVLIFTVFMLINREDLRNRLLRLVGVAQLNVMTQALDDAGKRISRYLVMQFLINAVFGLLFGLGLFLIGIPNATLWGVIAGLLRFVPYIGSLFAAALPLALALAVFDSWVPPLLVFVLFAVLELITANFVEPWLYGTHTGISSLAILVATVFWTVLWGWAGLVLSMPLTVCVIVLGRYFPELSFLHILLGDEPVLPPNAQFYQRLLAMDQNEAHKVADLFLQRRPLVELYDEVVVPALSMAEQDRHKGALDEAREAFLFLSVSELIAELAECKHESDSLKALDQCVRVLCVPASDQADEITSSMLAQLVEQAGYPALSFPVGSLLDESLARIEPEPEDIICISSLPPFAFVHARTSCRQLRARWPRTRLIVGLWAYTGDLEKTKQRFGNTPPDCLATTLSQAMEQIREWQSPGTITTSLEPERAEVVREDVRDLVASKRLTLEP